MNRLQKILGASLFSLALIGIPNKSYATEVLTSSARDYVESKETSLGDYTMRGVHSVGYLKGGRDGLILCNVGILRGAPNNTEVIVDYKFSPGEDSIGEFNYLCSGTALIPK